MRCDSCTIKFTLFSALHVYFHSLAIAPEDTHAQQEGDREAQELWSPGQREDGVQEGAWGRGRGWDEVVAIEMEPGELGQEMLCKQLRSTQMRFLSHRLRGRTGLLNFQSGPMETSEKYKNYKYRQSVLGPCL